MKVKLTSNLSSSTGGRGDDLRRAVARVVAAGNCTGCGLCATLSDSIEMRLDGEGQLRPFWTGGDTVRQADVTTDSVAEFRQCCPGVGSSAPRTPGALKHATLGPYVSAWEAWSSDQDVRRAGSSAGVLTTLSGWLIDTGRAPAVIGAGGSPAVPSRTEPKVLRTSDEARASAGSRYAPVAVASLFRGAEARTGAASVCKPCEAFAIRRRSDLMINRGELREAPIILSFFCAGVPAQPATDDLVQLLAGDAKVSSVRYRGDGWPGRFTIRDDGNRIIGDVDYEESWGTHLSRQVQERCKICPDGTGEHADIAVGDYWHAGANGEPIFTEADGRSVAIARTRRGHETLLAARNDGVICLRPLDLDDVAGVQPHQVQRRRTVLPRLIGRLLAGRSIPRFRGYRMLSTEFRTSQSMRKFLLEFIRVTRGSRHRAASRR